MVGCVVCLFVSRGRCSGGLRKEEGRLEMCRIGEINIKKKHFLYFFASLKYLLYNNISIHYYFLDLPFLLLLNLFSSSLSSSLSRFLVKKSLMRPLVFVGDGDTDGFLLVAKAWGKF